MSMLNEISFTFEVHCANDNLNNRAGEDKKTLKVSSTTDVNPVQFIALIVKWVEVNAMQCN